MANTLLTLALVAAQALPWAGGPLFACVSRDGAVCLDRGPESCQGCDSHRCESASHCDEHEACGGHEHEPAATSSVAEWSAAPCDCRHELVTQAPALSATQRASQSIVDLHHDSFGLATVATPATALVDCSGVAAITASFGASLPNARVGLLASIVIRC
jgi:hypothetical protein